MYKRLMDILVVLAKEVIEKDLRIEDAVVRIDHAGMDLYSVRDELRTIESMNLLNEEETDALKSILVYLFMNNTEIDPEDIYAMIFSANRRIIWH